MIIHFYLRFCTKFGQTLSVSGDIEVLGNQDNSKAFPLTYFNNEFWYGKMESPSKHFPESIKYFYLLQENDGQVFLEAERARTIDLTNNTKEIILIDTWNDSSNIENAFYTKPFQNVLLHPIAKIPKIKSPKFFTHQFKVKAPLLHPYEWVCVTGSGNVFKNWDVKKLLPLKPDGQWFSIKINLAKEEFPVEYKYGIYNTKNKTFWYEDGSNRLLKDKPLKKQLVVLHDGFLQSAQKWKGAGVAIPVFSLRSKNGFGTGEFNDIKLLVDWAQQTGLQLLQFLPINDTSSTHTSADSYPYSAISAFALHPLYVNIDAVAGKKNAFLVNALNKKKKQLNELPELNYEEVMKFKLSVLKELYYADKQFEQDADYLDFFLHNRHWLIPYAAFCFLRDKYETADSTKWKANKTFNEDTVQKLVSPQQPHYDEICFHYFIQYHLHLQLKSASKYAHSKGIILKGDIPIGVGKNSCDVWVDPFLFNLNEQAGAPPDDFAIKGQNWGFPTYNWRNMHQDGFAWWKNRFRQMNNYFDAFRIDHILGFFRIWSIPKHAVEGILGRFVPAIPINITEFDKNRIWFDYNRFCKPFISENILRNEFVDDTKYVKDSFLNKKENDFYELKEEFNTQKKVDDYFKEESIIESDKIKAGLFNLISNVILIEEEVSNSDDNQKQQFHFRIAMHQSSSFQQLDPYTQKQLSDLYNNYFFQRQDVLWRKESLQKLPQLKNSTDMLICGEDLGMVPSCVPLVMKQLGILSLEIQRMPKDPATKFFHPRNAPYLSVVMPSTHDMSTIREWWEEDKNTTQQFYNYEMGHYGPAPVTCEPWICKEIILQHLYSPAMWSIFQLQDVLGMDEMLRRPEPDEERINIPANPNHCWNYRMHIDLEGIIKEKKFNQQLKKYVNESGRI
ncbi:MAG: 4-alpha-glucanotransferase [Bacteroidota bacterium]|nr:4-alpha-glucanotransferase [Bacteroidota bacterium]